MQRRVPEKLVTYFSSFLKISRNFIFIGKIGLTINSERQRAWNSQGYFLKKYYYFQNSSKNGNKVETIEKS